MAIKVYKIDNENYALVDSAEAEKIKKIDDLKSQNLLLSVAGVALAIPAAIITSGALATLMTTAGIFMTVETMRNTERIRELEGKDIDLMYVLNQGLAVPSVLLPLGSMAARGLQKSATFVQTLDGVGTSYSLATGPVSVGLAAPDLYNDRKQYYIDRGEDLNYEKWKTALQYRINEVWPGPSSYRSDALRILGENATIGAVDAKPVTSPDVVSSGATQPSVADTLFDLDGNAIKSGWLASQMANPLDKAMELWDKTVWPWTNAPVEFDTIIFKAGDWTYETEFVTESE